MRAVIALLDRLVPALLMGSSVALLTAGLLSITRPASGEWATPAPSGVPGDPLLAVPPAPTPRPPAATGHPPPSRSPDANRGFASRIRIPSLGVDLAVVPSDLVVPGNRDFYPLCDVAMFMREFVQPGETGASYIYAHAQRGMFAPLLSTSEVDGGAALIGALIEVYTTDDRLHLYEIYRVKRHATDLSLATAPAGEHILVLQTSEGPAGTIPKLQVAARPLSVVPARHDEANPVPKPRVCLPS